MAKARKVLRVLEDFLQGPYFMGDRVSLADLWLVPMIAYLRLAPSGPELLAPHGKLRTWWDGLSARQAIQDTSFPEEIASVSDRD